MTTEQDFRKRAIWIAVMVVATFLFSWRFACATPFAALAAIAALTMEKRDAILLVAFSFALNQLVGFTLLGYPTDPATIGWGAAIGVGAGVALTSAFIGIAYSKSFGIVFATMGAYIFASIGYQLVMWAAFFALPGMFQWAVVLEVVQLNTLAVLALLGVHALGRMTGLATAKTI